jgi:hypothetical protein
MIEQRAKFSLNWQMAVRTHLIVATHDYQAGKQLILCNNYNKLTPFTMAESYGFLDLDATYINIPSISKDLQESPAAQGIDPCITEDMVFFGDVPEGHMEAKFCHLHQTT